MNTLSVNSVPQGKTGPKVSKRILRFTIPVLSIVGLLCMSAIVMAQTQLGQNIAGEAMGDQFGYSVSLSADGSRLAVGALLNDGNGENSGHVRVYRWTESTWSQLGNDINGEAAGDRFGRSVSLSSDGNRLAVGADQYDKFGSAGYVRVYQWNGSSWQQLGADIDGEAANDLCGRSVSLSSDGDRLAIGAPSNDGNGDGAGQTRVFKWSGTVWQQMGVDINGEAAEDRAGYSVSLSADGNSLAIGAYGNKGDGEYSGRVRGQVRVYRWNGSSWQQMGTDIDGDVPHDYFGYSVSLSADGDRLASGAWGNSGGYVRVFDWTGTEWLQLGDDIKGREESGQLGASVALPAGGNLLAVGDTGFDGGNHASGQVKVYQWSDETWTQLGDDINGNAEYDFLGTGLALSSDGNRLAAGAVEGYLDGTGTGRVSVYDFSMFNVFQMNPGLNDAWYYPLTSGQGFFITVFPDLGAVSLAWFTYDTELPPADAVSNLGDPGLRWLTAVGPIDGNQSVMDIELTSGGIFDTSTEITRTDPPGSDGTLLITFDSCNSGTVEYDIPSINRQGIVPIQRVADDNVALCEALNSN